MPVLYQALDGHPPEEAGIVDEGLDAYNQESAPLDAVQHVTCLARDADGRVIGGAVGRTWGECAELLQLWVSPAQRKQGVGTSLLRRFEAHVAGKGCRTCYLTTFSFQAPDLYRSQGYVAASEIRGFPRGIVKYLMIRTLDGPSSQQQ